MWRLWLAVGLVVVLGALRAQAPQVPQQQPARGEQPLRWLGGSITYLAPSELAPVVWGEELPPAVPAAPGSLLWRLRVDEYGRWRRMLQ